MSVSRYDLWYKAPPDERGGNRHARPNVTAPHSYSTDSSRQSRLEMGRAQHHSRRNSARRDIGAHYCEQRADQRSRIIIDPSYSKLMESPRRTLPPCLTEA